MATDGGTMIKTFSLETRQLVSEFCRGRNQATINSISSNEQYISCTSDHGTTHIFKVGGGQQDPTNVSGLSNSQTEESKDQGSGNTKSFLSMMPLIGSRFNSEYAFTKINREKNDDDSGEFCIIKEDRAIIITMNGNYRQFQISQAKPVIVQQATALLQKLSK